MTAGPGRAEDPEQAVPDPPAPVNDVELVAVSKSFGSVNALTDLSLNLVRSRITVLLGPNGAGKTTATRIITGALAPDVGTSRVFGIDPAGNDGEDVRRQCGVVSAKPSLYERLSGRDNLRYAASLYGLGTGAGAERRIDEAAEQFDIHRSLDLPVGGYSTGMVTRLALARAILHRPRLLLLDEPTSGLDPESSAAVLAMVREMTTTGHTVLMCTHLLAEAEGLADQVVILDDGANLLSGQPEVLARRYWPTTSVTVEATDPAALDPAARWPEVTGYRRDQRRSELQLAPSVTVPELVAKLVQAGIALESVTPFRPTLEDLYFAVRREHQGRSDHGQHDREQRS